jgi:hypothetical protein
MVAGVLLCVYPYFLTACRGLPLALLLLLHLSG